MAKRGATALAEALRSNETLESLDMSHGILDAWVFWGGFFIFLSRVLSDFSYFSYFWRILSRVLTNFKEILGFLVFGLAKFWLLFRVICWVSTVLGISWGFLVFGLGGTLIFFSRVFRGFSRGFPGFSKR